MALWAAGAPLKFIVKMIWSFSTLYLIIISNKHLCLSILFLHLNEDDDEVEVESHQAAKKNETIEGRQPAWEDDADEEERYM